MSSLRPTRRRTASVKENAIPTDILSNRETVSPSVTTNRKKKKQCSRQATRGLSQSCHQCRQSIHSSKGANEMKLGHQRIKCSQCTRYWCEKCLDNRYGLSRHTINIFSWYCPVCSNNCNCSLCRKKNGKLATGILTPLVKNAGYSSVSEFLQSSSDDIAKCLQWQSPVMNMSEGKKTNIVTDVSMCGIELCHENCSISTSTTAADINNDNTRLCAMPIFCTHTPNDDSSVKRFIARQRKRRKQCRPKKITTEVMSSVTVATDFETVIETECDESEERREEKLMKLKEMALVNMRQRLEQKRKEEKVKRLEERKRARERKLEEKENRRKVREKLAKAKQILKDVRRKSETERLQKLLELKRATQLAKENKMKKQQLVTVPLSAAPLDISSCNDDISLHHCLPEYPLLDLGVATEYVGRLLFVSEYLNTFGEILDMKEKITSPKLLCTILQRKHTNDLFYSLLKPLIDSSISDEHSDRDDTIGMKKLTKRNAEEFAIDYMKCKTDIAVALPDDNLQSRLIVLAHLVNALLDCKLVTNAIKDVVANFEEEQKKFRLKLSTFTKESMSTLKTMCDSGSSVNELIDKREQLTQQLQELQKLSPKCSSLIRSVPLGIDREGRLYWRLSTILGVTVEDIDHNKWMIIDDSDLLNEVLMSLNRSNVNENKLHSNLKKEFQGKYIF